jgi:hypothetical protein
MCISKLLSLFTNKKFARKTPINYEANRNFALGNIKYQQPAFKRMSELRLGSKNKALQDAKKRGELFRETQNEFARRTTIKRQEEHQAEFKKLKRKFDEDAKERMRKFDEDAKERMRKS